MHEQITANSAEPSVTTLEDGPVRVTAKDFALHIAMHRIGRLGAAAMRRTVLAVAVPLAGCAIQPPVEAPPPNVAAQWREASITAQVHPREDWWRSLNDAGIDALMASASRQSTVPATGLEVEEAPFRLGLQADVAEGAVALRACVLAAQQLMEDVQSRVADIETERDRLGVEVVRRTELQRAIVSVANARVAATDSESQCTLKLHNLGALTGLHPDDVIAAMNLDGPLTRTAIPIPPQSAVAPPSILLPRHPAVVASARKVEAAYVALAGASADRYPRLSLSGSDVFFHVGVGEAAIRRRNSAYEEAVFKLNQVLRETARDVESALVQIQAAGSREQFARAGVVEAQALVRTTLAGYGVGQISFSELQQTRGFLLSARQSQLTAQRDRVQGWVALVRASANAVQAFPGPHAAAPVAALHQRAPGLFPGQPLQ
ncbi:MAG TPA: TolC family protein [Burkholderiaceae bacterium]|nr:TolC family protein [Burkholderiaceae bacterium]